MSTAFNPRSIVGMSMRKRRELADEQYHQRMAESEKLPNNPQKGDYLKRATAGLQVGWHLMGAHLLSSPDGIMGIKPRMRPCPGCQRCARHGDLTAWVKLAGFRGPFWEMRDASNDDDPMPLGRWQARVWVLSPDGSCRFESGGECYDRKKDEGEVAAQRLLGKLVAAMGWPEGCNGSGLLPAKRQPMRSCPGCWECDTSIQQYQSNVGYKHRKGCTHDNPEASCCSGERVVCFETCGGRKILSTETAL